MALLKIKDDSGFVAQGSVGIFEGTGSDISYKAWEAFATFEPTEDTTTWELGNQNFDVQTELRDKKYNEIMIVGSITCGGSQSAYGDISIMVNSFAGGSEVTLSDMMPRAGSTTTAKIWAKSLSPIATLVMGRNGGGMTGKNTTSEDADNRIICMRLWGHTPFASGTSLTLYGR